MYKKYIVVNGKRYGPYLYHNKRVGDKVVTSYHGSSRRQKTKNNFLPYGLIAVLLGVVLMVAGLLYFNAGDLDSFLASPFGNESEGNLSVGGGPPVLGVTETTGYGAVLWEPIVWKERVSVSEFGRYVIEIPISSESIRVDRIDELGNRETIRDDDAGDFDATDGDDQGDGDNETGDGGNGKTGDNSSVGSNQTIEDNSTSNNMTDNNNSTSNNMADNNNSTSNNMTDNNGSFLGNETGGGGNESGINFSPDNEAGRRVVAGSVPFGSEGGRGLKIPVSVEEGDSFIEISYVTPEPSAEEELIERGKSVKIVGDENVLVENVLAFTNFPEELNVRDEEMIRVFWVEGGIEITNVSVNDTNNDSVYDYVEWVVPHLSNQTFRIIVITEAEHLDLNRSFVSDIFEDVRELDGNWSETIPSGDYVRVVFERELKSINDITVYPKKVNGTPRIEVYEVEGNEVIASFDSLNDSEYNKVYLDGSSGAGLGNRSQDTFDLLILDGDVEFEHIIDPGTLPVMESIGYIPSGKTNYNSGDTVTFEAVWSDADGDSAMLLIDDSFGFENCNFAVQTGCLAFSVVSASSPIQASMIASSTTKWYAQICDVDGCDSLVADVAGSGGSLSGADAILIGVDAGDLSGTAIASGDFDNDGFDDILVGAPEANTGLGGEGEVYVVYGSGAFPPTVDLETEEDATLMGVIQSSLSGTSVASGDFNKDGFDDVLIGVPFPSGRSYIVYGGASRLIDDSLSNVDVTFLGEGASNLGKSVASGDFDGDGIDDDVIQGAPRYITILNPPRIVGAAYINFGGSLSQTIDISWQFDRLYKGTIDGDKIANSVAAGDLNNDGYDDLVVGAKDRFAKGSVFIVYNDNPMPPNGDIVSEVEISGSVANGFVGSSVAIGDFNNDAVEDLLIGASGEGKVYLFYGVDGVELTTTTTASADVVFSGVGDRAGKSVGVGDFDGDGIDDVVIGADNANSGAGETYVIYSSGALPFGASILLSDVGGSVSGAKFSGEVAGDNSGFSVASGDFNGDGVDEVWIGAPQADDGAEAGVGKTYIVKTKENIATGSFSVLELLGADYVPAGQSLYPSGSDVTIRGTWAAGGVADYKFLVDDNFGFESCNYNVQSGCLAFASTTGLTADAVISGVTLDTKWYAQVCDVNGVCDRIAQYNLGKSGSLSTEADVILTGIDPNDLSGYSISSGNVNGDAYEDILIGAYQADNGGGDEGEVHVVYGNETLPAVIGLDSVGDLSLGAVADGFVLTGVQASDVVGTSLVSGDFDGDGIKDEILIGAEGVAGGTFEGAGYVVDGSSLGTFETCSSAIGTRCLALDDASIVELAGSESFGSAGAGVSSGNFTGNAWDDVLIGVPFASIGASTYEGKTYIVGGGPSLASHTLGPSTDKEFVGINSNDYTGKRLVSGDFDGDGIADFLIGQDVGTSDGEIYLFYGSVSLVGNSLSNADAIFTGGAGDGAGSDVAAGDVNNDGYDDVIIGASQANKVYVVYGGASHLTGDSLSNADVIISGVSGEAVGASVSAGDFNGDEIDDILIGAVGANSNAGKTYVIFGGALPSVISLSDVGGSVKGANLVGIEAGDFSGWDIDSGDINGDGIRDVLISAYVANDVGSAEGESYVVNIARNDATGLITIIPSYTPTVEMVYDIIDNFGGGGTNEIQALAGIVNDAEIRFLVEDLNGVDDLPGGSAEGIIQSGTIGDLSSDLSNIEVYVTSPGDEHSSIDVLASGATCDIDSSCTLSNGGAGCLQNQMEYQCFVPMQYYYQPGSFSTSNPYTITIGVADFGNNIVVDSTKTFDYKPVVAFDIDNSLIWDSIDRSLTDQVADGSLGLINRGNKDFVSALIWASDLTPSSGQGGDNIPASAFSISIQSGGSPSKECDVVSHSSGTPETADELTSASSLSVITGGAPSLVYGDVANTGSPPPTPPIYNEELNFCLWKQLDALGLDLRTGSFSSKVENCPGGLPSNCVNGSAGHPWELSLLAT